MNHFAVFLLLAGVIAIGLASPCGDVVCPKLDMPQCAQNADLSWTRFANECELDNCGGAAAFSQSCYNPVSNSDADCQCPENLFI